MGLITGLLTLPLAPVRGVVWIAEQVALEAERGLDEETNVRRELTALEARLEAGDIDEAAFEAAEDALLDRLEAAREAE
jgi:hypothetical protein